MVSGSKNRIPPNFTMKSKLKLCCSASALLQNFFARGIHWDICEDQEQTKWRNM